MNLKFTAILLSFCSLTLGSFAQSSRRSTKVRTNALEDSLTTIGQRYTLALDSLNKSLETSAPSDTDNLENPYYFPLFASSTFYHFPVQLELGSLQSGSPSLQSGIAQALMYAYATHPELVHYNLSYYKGDRNKSVVAKPSTLPTDKGKPATPPKVSAQQLAQWQDFEPLALQIHRPNFWTFKGNFSLQFIILNVCK